MTMSDEDESPFKGKQVEWLYAEMETRLRVLVTELVSPTARRLTIQSTEIETMHALVNDHTKKINNMYQLQTKVVETSAALEAFREEFTKLDSSVHQKCLSSEQEIRQLRGEFDGQQKNLERKETAILHLERCLDRATMELNRVLAKQEDSFDKEVQKQLDEQRRVAHKMICELEAKIMGLELQLASITDQLWGEETGLAKVTGQVKKIYETVDTLSSAVTTLQASRVQPEHLARLREEVKVFLVKAESDMISLKMDVGNVVNDTKEHLRTALETVATQHATFMEEVRASYREELAYSAQLRNEVEAFVADVRKHQVEVNTRVEEASSRNTTVMTEQQAVIEDTDRKRKRDRTTLDLEIKGIQKRLGGIFDSHAEITKGFGHLRDVVGKMLGAAQMQCALDTQDTEDREKVFLLGLRDDSHREESLAPASPRPAKLQPSPRRTKKTAGQPQPIVKVDQRCLACSGSATTVLSAFKMACLQYNPSPVGFQEHDYTRFEILHRIRDFLADAHGMYEHGIGDGRAKHPEAPGTPRGVGTPPSGGGNGAGRGLIGGKADVALSEYSSMAVYGPRTPEFTRLPTLHRSMPAAQPRGKEMIE